MIDKYEIFDQYRNPFKRIIAKSLKWILKPVYDQVSIQQQEIKELKNNCALCMDKIDQLDSDIEEICNRINYTDQLIEETENKIYHKQNEYMERINIQQYDYQQRLDAKCIEVLNQVKQIRETLEWEKDRLTKHEDEINSKLASSAREIMRTKWKVIDSLNTESVTKHKCIICGFEFNSNEAEIKTSECIFAGGKLQRYVCPQCGCIFGPDKFRNQSQNELSDDYVVHYAGFDENDSTIGEKDTFFLLNPTKTGVYLDYGCGKWANTIIELREQGYNVYGFDMYASDVDNPYIISDINKLKKMRFDGIFSHDLLEHLLNPIEDILFMKGLLRSPKCLMAHSTACYNYKFEYTRFHTCFFTGDAVSYLCKMTNMDVENFVDDGELQNFVCYVYKMKDEYISFIDDMGASKKLGKTCIAKNGGQIFGPYINVQPGKMVIFVNVDTDSDDTRMIVTANKGADVITSFPIAKGNNQIEILIEQYNENVEFIVQTNQDQEVKVIDIGIISYEIEE